MKRARILLCAILFCAAIGAAFANKAKSITVYYYANNTYNPTQTDSPCPITGWGCAIIVNSSAYQMYSYTNLIFVPKRF